MSEVEIACLKSRSKLVGRGIYREVYKIGRFVVKIEKSQRGTEKLQNRAEKLRRHNLELHKKLNFLPTFYGAILTAVKRRGRWTPVVATIHEYIPPISLTSLENLRSVIQLVNMAAKEGYVIDIKPSNFGKKGKKLYYLDELGVGRGPIPPDVFEDLSEILGKLIQLRVKVSRVHVRLSKKMLPNTRKD